MKIAVLGGGHGCYAAVADFSERGHSVRWWRRDAAALRSVGERGSLTLTDAQGTREIPVDTVTPDLAAALDDAELVFTPLPATAQVGLSAHLAPLLSNGQVVHLPPGTFGSLIFARAMRAAGNPAGVAFAESGTLPWLTRKQAPDHVAVRVRATRLPTGVFPATETDRVLGVIGNVLPSVEPLRDALDAALMNAGPIIHPPLILLNAGPLQHFERWDIHNEGTQPGIRRVTDALDAERILVREALGYAAPHFPLADHYDDARDEWMYGNSSHERLTDSGDWREHIDLTSHRYMREDVALGLAFLISVGEWSGVHTPVARGLLAIGSALAGEEFGTTGRTLGNLGLASHSRENLSEFLIRGLDQ